MNYNSYDIIIHDRKMLSINPNKDTLLKAMLQYIAQDTTSKKIDREIQELAHYLDDDDLKALNSFLVSTEKDEYNRVKWKDLVTIFEERMVEISNMTLPQINAFITLNMPKQVNLSNEQFKTLPIKDIKGDKIISLLGKGEQTELGEMWINNKDIPESEKTEYLKNVKFKEKDGLYQFNDRQLKINKYQDLNASTPTLRSPQSSFNTDFIIEDISPQDQNNIRNTGFKIATVIYASPKIIETMYDIDLNEHEGHAVMVALEENKNIIENTEYIRADTRKPITALKIMEIRGNSLVWFDTELSEHEEITDTNGGNESSVFLTNAFEDELLDLRKNYVYSYKWLTHNKIKLFIHLANEITPTEHSARSVSYGNQIAGTKEKNYRPTTIISGKQDPKNILQAQTFLESIKDNYNSLSKAVEELGE